MVAHRGRPAMDKGREEAEDVRMEIKVGEHFKEYGVIYSIKGLRQISRRDHRAKGRFALVEPSGDFRCEREKGGYGGAAGAKAMLGRGFGKEREEVGTDEAFEDFRGRAEKGDGAEGGAEMEGLTGFRDRENEGMFPDSG